MRLLATQTPIGTPFPAWHAGHVGSNEKADVGITEGQMKLSAMFPWSPSKSNSTSQRCEDEFKGDK
jgi:hypothetical protein